MKDQTPKGDPLHNPSIGKVEKVNDDGTVTVRLDLENPKVAKLLADWFTVGKDEANKRFFAYRN